MNSSSKPRLWSVEYWLRHARRAVILVVGGTVLLLGVVMIVTPGPAFLVIPAGLAILATEFAWARHWLRRAKELIGQKPAKQAPPPKLHDGAE